MAVYFELEQSAGDVDGARDVTFGEFLRLAHVDDRHSRLAKGRELMGPDLADACARGGDEVADGVAQGVLLRFMQPHVRPDGAR